MDVPRFYPAALVRFSPGFPTRCKHYARRHTLAGFLGSRTVPLPAAYRGSWFASASATDVCRRCISLPIHLPLLPQTRIGSTCGLTFTGFFNRDAHFAHVNIRGSAPQVCADAVARLYAHYCGYLPGLTLPFTCNPHFHFPVAARPFFARTPTTDIAVGFARLRLLPGYVPTALDYALHGLPRLPLPAGCAYVGLVLCRTAGLYLPWIRMRATLLRVQVPPRAFPPPTAGLLTGTTVLVLL